MSRIVRKAAVLGAGTMGSRIAAHFANAGVDCLLLDLDLPTVTRLCDAMQKGRPPALFTPATAARLETGAFSTHLARLSEADWIVEAVVENFEAKRALLPQVDRHRKPGTLVTSNTSGLPIASLAAGLSPDFRSHWIGVHFFNPPRYMRLVELIPTPETRPDVVEFVRDFCDRRLGKVTVFAKDRPNFIANRLYMFATMHLLRAMQAHGLTIEEVDALTGPLIGRPATATFRLADFVGVDVCVFVSENLHRLVPEDERRDVLLPPEFLKRMVERSLHGDKAGGGFYKRVKDGRLVLNLETFEYGPPRPVHLPGLEAAQQIREVGARIRYLVSRDDRAGRFLWETWRDLLLYAAHRIPEIADDLVSVDTTLRCGFNWEIGLFEAWDAIGVRESARRMEAEGCRLPPLVEKLLASGETSFYRQDQDQRLYFDLGSGSRRPVPAAPGVLRLAVLWDRRQVLLSNPSASLLHLGGGVLGLEFRSKAATLDPGVLTLLRSALEETEAHYEGLVIGHEGPNFSVGANLNYLLELSRAGRWPEIDQAVATTQQTFLALRACPKPVVAAVFGQTLAGGCELALHAPRVQAHAETYMGLVETGVGLIPAAGGCKELVRRWTTHLPAEADPLPYLKEAFETIALAKVSQSAAEAVERRLLREEDPVTMNRDRLLEDARRTVLAMARLGYQPDPEPPQIFAGGRPALAALELGVHLMRRAGYLSDHDAKVGRRLARVLCGGELTEPGPVPENYLLDLEREAFLSLCGEAKTQERMEYVLRTGKPLRN